MDVIKPVVYKLFLERSVASLNDADAWDTNSFTQDKTAGNIS